MSILPRQLLPDSAEVAPDGSLLIGGCDVAGLAEEFGTPLFVYDEDQLRSRCREAVAAFGDGVAYATKAFLCRAMARLAHEEGMHLDVASGGELAIALAAGVPADRLEGRLEVREQGVERLPGEQREGVGGRRGQGDGVEVDLGDASAPRGRRGRPEGAAADHAGG